MKNNIIKLLCLVMVFAMLIALVGCKNSEDTNNSSLSTSSVNSDITNSETDLDTSDEDEEDISYYQNVSYFILNSSTAYEIIDDIIYFQDYVEADSYDFLKRLGAVKKLEIKDTDYVTAGDNKLIKTNIKYIDFKNKMLTYISKEYFESSIFANSNYFAEKDGYLYFTKTKGSEKRKHITDLFFKGENGSKIEYVVTLIENINDEDKYYYMLVDFVKNGDIYVVNSCSDINKEDAIFKGYDKLNDITVRNIIGEFLDVKYSMTGDSCGLIDCVVDYPWDFDDTKTYETEYETLLKTNVKYKDFVNGALRYMTKERFEKDFLATNFYKEKNGYLYSISLGATGYSCDVLDVAFEKEVNGKYTYIAKCGFNDINSYSLCYYKVNIVKVNGKYVVDSLEAVDEKEISLKNHNKLNDNTVKYIIENGINIKTELETTQYVMLNHLLPSFEKNNSTKKVEIGETTFYDTKIKYADFTKAILPFVSQKYFNSIKTDSFKEIKNNLYVAEFDEWMYSTVVLDATLENDSNGEYKYLAKCYSASYEIGCFYINATIVKENGKYVLDSYEVIEK